MQGLTLLILLPPSFAPQAYLGFYNSNLKKLNWGVGDCVAHANEFALAVVRFTEI